MQRGYRQFRIRPLGGSHWALTLWEPGWHMGQEAPHSRGRQSSQHLLKSSGACLLPRLRHPLGSYLACSWQLSGTPRSWRAPGASSPGAAPAGLHAGVPLAASARPPAACCCSPPPWPLDTSFIPCRQVPPCVILGSHKWCTHYEGEGLPPLP